MVASAPLVRTVVGGDRHREAHRASGGDGMCQGAKGANADVGAVGGDGNGAKSGGGLLCASLCVARFHFSPTVFW